MPPYAYLAIAGGVFLLLMVTVQFLNNRGNLNHIKSRTVGDGQHGTARFMTSQEKKMVYRELPFTPELWRKGENLPQSQGIIVGQRTKRGHTVALIDEGDVHALMIGAAGCGKTAYFLTPNIEFALASGISFLSTDSKGDIFRNYGRIAMQQYGYHVAVLDLRNPTKSDGFNLLHLACKYMDAWKLQSANISYKAKAEKYAKIIAKTIIGETGDKGVNSFFYDAAEGLLTSVILLIAEFAEPKQRHIISVFKLVQDLLEPSQIKGKSAFQVLMMRLPGEHKAKWFSGAALNSSEQGMASVLSTVLSRLNAFLDSELEQVLCFDTAIDAEKFCNEKSALFVVMPEENPGMFFMVSLIIQQLYREILSVADEKGGKLDKRVMFFCDELGTLPPIESAEMMFSAARSRKLSIVAVIQSYQQLEKNYGREGAAIITDNTQLTIAGGFAPGSESAERISKSLGSRTVLSGSVTKGKDNTSQQMQMTERPLLSPDELKSMKKGSFIVLKTGTHPFISQLKLFFQWGIQFDEANPYSLADQGARAVAYADKAKIEAAIIAKFPDIVVPIPEPKSAPQPGQNRRPQPQKALQIKVN
jgi:type IV secretion system protein VirD4